jgi:hypothetical protein
MDGRIIVWVRRIAMCAVVRVSSASARVHFASPVQHALMWPLEKMKENEH